MQIRQLSAMSVGCCVRLVRAHQQVRAAQRRRDHLVRGGRRVALPDAAASRLPQLLQLHQLRALRQRELLRMVGRRGTVRAARPGGRRRDVTRDVSRALPPARRLRALPGRARPLRVVRGHAPVLQFQRVHQRVPVRTVSRVAGPRVLAARRHGAQVRPV